MHGFGAHTAPLGIAFYEPPRGTAPAAFPARYRGAAFVALHGSWNRSKKSGYQVVALHFAPDGTIREEPFATGFMIDEKVTGRPVDVAVGPDGALYVSDDFTGSIYRIAYGQAAQAAAAAGGARHAARSRSPGSSRAQIRPPAPAAPRSGKPTAAPPATIASQAAPNAYRPLDALASKYTLDSLTAVPRRRRRRRCRPTRSATTERRDLAVYLLTTYP